MTDAGPENPENNDERFVPKVPATVATEELDGEAVLLHEETGAIHTLDAIATAIWNCFDGSRTLGDIVDDLAERYQAEAETVRHDVLTLAADLRRQGLLEGAPPTATGDG